MAVYVNQKFTIIGSAKDPDGNEIDISTAISKKFRLYYPKLKQELFVDAEFTVGSISQISAAISGEVNSRIGPLEIWLWIVLPDDPNRVPGEPVTIMIEPVPGEVISV